VGQTKTLITAEELPKIAGDRRVELVYGELRDMTPIGIEHAGLVARLLSWIVLLVDRRKLGLAGPELGCVLSRDPDVVRAPDISFISSSRLPSRQESGFFNGAPDLAVEVLSPSDTASEVQQKVQEYLQAGAKLVWIVDPQTKAVTAYEPSGNAHVYRGGEAVPGDPVLPGFSFQPDALFDPD
jgi:Uma2 family endonuclease